MRMQICSGGIGHMARMGTPWHLSRRNTAVQSAGKSFIYTSVGEMLTIGQSFIKSMILTQTILGGLLRQEVKMQ